MFKDYESKAKGEFMSHVSPEIVLRCESPMKIRLREYQAMRINSYEMKYIEPFLSDEALLFRIEYAVSNCFVESSRYKCPVTYNDYIQTDGINELIKRFKDKIK